MNKHPELATATLTVVFSALLSLTGYLYIEHRATREAGNPTLALTRPAGVKDGLDIRLVSERSPYMRSER